MYIYFRSPDDALPIPIFYPLSGYLPAAPLYQSNVYVRLQRDACYGGVALRRVTHYILGQELYFDVRVSPRNKQRLIKSRANFERVLGTAIVWRPTAEQ